MIRDESLRQIFKSQAAKVASLQLKELCYGKGFALLKGKSIPLGMCSNGAKKPPNIVYQDNISYNGMKTTFNVKKGAYVTRVNPNASDNQSYDTKLNRL